MSRKLGAFDPASTASTSVVTETSDFTNLYLTFDNGSTDDSSPQNVTVTDVASASYDSTNVAAGSAAILLYEGSGVSYTSSSADRLRFQTSDVVLSSNFTIECFFRTTQGGGDIAGRQVLLAYSIYADSRDGYSGLLFWITGGALKLYASSGSSSWNVISNQAWGTVSVNTYHHIALTREGNVYRGYFDGARAFETTAGSFHITGSASMIGSRDTGGSYTFNGQIDDFRILNGVALHTSSSLTVPTTNVGVNVTAETFDTRTHSHVWNYPDIYKARRADTWPDPAPATRTIQIHVAGGGGGGGSHVGGDGGDGGVVSVQKSGVTAGTILTYVVGGGGKGGFHGGGRTSGQVIGITSGPMQGGGALVASDGDFQNNANQSGAEGGAGSGVFLSTATQANAIVIAGGGGGGAGNNAGEGGAGGGQGTAADSSLLGQDGKGGTNRGEDGKPSRGGRHGNGTSPRTTAGALLGQTNIYGGSGYTSGGGGGGGYYGGGGGGHGGSAGDMGGAGGGSGYVSSEWTRIESILSLPAGGANATTGADGANGKVVITVDGSTAVSVTSTGTTATYEVV